MTECRHGLSEDCHGCMQETIDTLVKTPPMLADIAQIIDAGWKSWKSAAEVALEIVREFDDPASQDGKQP